MDFNENKQDGQNFDEAGQSRARSRSKKKSAAITASIVLLVIIVNLIFSAFSMSGLWYFDLTKNRYKSNSGTMYRPSENFLSLISDEAIPMIREINKERENSGEESIKLNIIFCNDPDFIDDNEYLRYINYTARALKKEFPDCVDVEYINMRKNPSAVQKYKVTSAATIYNTDVIVEFGTEFLVHGMMSFFTANSDNEAPWAYNGEKRFASSILSVTRADAPICCITTNHGENLYDSDGKINEEYSAFEKVIKGAGYIVLPIDFEKDEIPENCRMIITFNPKKDFKAYGDLGENGISEIAKLDKYLDNAYSFFYICDRTTPKLKNLEEYLEEWGISIGRADGTENYAVKDTTMNVDSGVGNKIVGNYALHGAGASITSDMRENGYPPNVIFGNSTAFKPSPVYRKMYISAEESESAEAFSYYRYSKNGVSRSIYDVFTTYSTAHAEIDGETYEIATSENMFSLMTITQERRQIQEDNYNAVNDASYVLALASTEFVSNEVLGSTAYGNTDVLLSALRNTSHEVIPVNIDLKAFYGFEIDDNANTGNNLRTMLCLSLIPAIVAIVLGVIVTVRRKYA